MQATKKGKAFLIYVFPISNVESLHHEIPSQYKEFKDVFEKKNANTLPEHRPYDCAIDLEGAQLPFGLIYNLSQNELAALREYINENLEKRFNQHSKFPTSAPILFCQKKGWIFANVCRLLWIESTHHQESVSSTPNLKIVGPSKLCQGVYQN